MVYLNRIYTKTGDDGQTSLGDGTRISKTHPRIVAYGGVDELNSVLGMARNSGISEETDAWLALIQNDLFDIGADLCVPEAAKESESEPPAREPLRITTGQVEQLERWIDAANERLTPLTSFVLPGGSPASAHLHLARTVCRRVEVNVLHLAEFEVINPQVNIYLNRLSDLLFVLSRLANENGASDVLWVPGKGRAGG